MKILNNFDRVVAEVLADKVKARLTFKVCLLCYRIAAFASCCTKNKCFSAQGHLETYRFCDDVWTFLVKDVHFKCEQGNTFQADKVKIVSCNSKRPGEA